MVQDAARTLGWPSPAIYVDIGPPGTHRPGTELSRLTGYLNGGRHDALIVRDLTRISRDCGEVLAFACGCICHGVVIEAIEEGRIDRSCLAALYAKNHQATRVIHNSPAGRGWRLPRPG